MKRINPPYLLPVLAIPGPAILWQRCSRLLLGWILGRAADQFVQPAAASANAPVLALPKVILEVNKMDI